MIYLIYQSLIIVTRNLCFADPHFLSGFSLFVMVFSSLAFIALKALYKIAIANANNKTN